LNPNTSIRHNEPEGAMAMRSEGLLQLAYADHKHYGCDFQLGSGPSAKGERSGNNHSPAEEQSGMWSQDSVQPAHRPAQTIAEPAAGPHLTEVCP
jgi:hypothetical protein